MTKLVSSLYMFLSLLLLSVKDPLVEIFPFFFEDKGKGMEDMLLTQNLPK